MTNQSSIGKNILLFTLLGLSASVYIILGYFTPRDEFSQLMLLFVCAFLLAGTLFTYFNDYYKLIAFVSILFRAALLFSVPSLTDDFYRFFWDGSLYSNGVNPYLHLPAEYMKEAVLAPNISSSLFEHLNSPNYFTIYPPLCQYMFWVACNLGNGISQSVLVMKAFVLLAEIGSILLMVKLLKLFKIRPQNLLIYALNPLVIIELSGNLHFEAVMIFFLLLAVYLFKSGKITLSATSLAMAVSVKLLPLIFLPLLIKRLKMPQMVLYAGVVGTLVVLLFFPFYDHSMATNLWSSILLYFQTFEFNASVYYLFRWIGRYITGYNNIAVIGPLLSVVTLSTVLYLSLRKNSDEGSRLLVTMLLAITVYFLLSTTVHPWYITTLVALGAFTKYQYASLWSFLVLLSYAAYAAKPFHENFYLLGLEYLFLAGFIAYERFGKLGRTEV